MFFIVSNNRDLVGSTPDHKRVTRSSKNTTPIDKYPSLDALETKKRENKVKNKK
jgi:hypothetical protein